jgi:hypothetical protein
MSTRDRRGGPYDRGSADAYYGRGFSPHYYEGASYATKRVTIYDPKSEEYRAYHAGYHETTDRKDWT